LAFLGCYARQLDDRTLYKLVKPLPVLTSAIFLFWQTMEYEKSVPLFVGQVMTVGLLLGAAADLLLILPGMFVLGIIAFAGGHLLYIVALLPFPNYCPWYWIPWIALVLAATSLGVWRIPIEQEKRLAFGMLVQGYMFVLGGIIYKALAMEHYFSEATGIGSSGVGLGAVMFGVSDVLLVGLVFIRFPGYLRPLSSGPLLVYYSSQMILSYGTVRLCRAVDQGLLDVAFPFYQ